MDWEQALRARLKTSSQINALVGPRVDWDERPQATGLPAITLQTIDETTGQSYSDVDGSQRVLVQIDGWAKSSAQRAELKRVIKDSLIPAAEADGFRWSRGFPSGGDSTERLGTETIYRTRIDFELYYSAQ